MTTMKDRITALRKNILKRYDLVRHNYDMVVQVRENDFDVMYSRLIEVRSGVEQAVQGIGLTEDHLYTMMQELDTLRCYFGAPTVRPLEAHAVRYMDPYQQTCELLFLFDVSMVLYLEMVRNTLAMLEYQIPCGEDISHEVGRLIKNLSLINQFSEHTTILDAQRRDLGHYLMEIHGLVHPLFRASEKSELSFALQSFYLTLPTVFSFFDCAPETLPPDLKYAMLMAAAMMLPEKSWSRGQAVLVIGASEFLWERELEDMDRNVLAALLRRALEVVEDA